MIAACAQMQALTIDEAAGVWPTVEHLAAAAGRARADLLVFPETTYPAYYLESAGRYRRSNIWRTAVVLERFAALAAAHRMWIVAGLVEESGDRLYNSAAVFDRQGRIVGVARKHFLWDCDHEWFAPGEAPVVLDTEFGPMGVLICADARMPEIPASLVHLGAEFIVQPTAWVNTTTEPGLHRNIQPEFLIQSRAVEFNVPFICASKAGKEGNVLEYVGQSRILAAGGGLLAEAPPSGDTLVAAECSVASPRPPRLTEQQRQRLLSSRPPTVPDQPGPLVQLPLHRSVSDITMSLTSAGARVGRIAAAELLSFAPARCHALDGAQVLVAEGYPPDGLSARARAAENRVFVIVAGPEMAAVVVNPDGVMVWRSEDGPPTFELDTADADVKQFNPRTHLWAQRNPAFFRF